MNLLGLKLEDRPPFFESLLHAILDLRARTGLPHWLIIDEAHHLFPASWPGPPLALSREAQGLFIITVHPDHVAPRVLSLVNALVVIGEEAEKTVASFARATGSRQPMISHAGLRQGEAFIWKKPQGDLVRIRTLPPRAELRRHLRKYAEGELPPERSFWFRGPDNRLNLKAQNLRLFLQIADGVDDETWQYHFRQGDYSRWFREMIKDRKLAEEVEYLEKRDLPPDEGRRLIRAIIEEHYTAAA